MVRGYIVPIGGAEEKTQNPKILERFVAVCGGSDAVIAVIPTASRLEETGPSYVRFFESLGVKKARTFPIEERSDGEREDWIEALDRATGVFLTGGNQLRLTTYLGGTTLATALRRRNADGLHIAGTSAGAAYLAGHMIAYGRGGATPRAEKVTLSPGLGLLNSAVIDQHFRQRDRIGRLLTALAFNPFAVGMGLDEDTAAFIGPDYTLEVVGSGALTVLDPSGLSHSSMAETKKGKPICLIGIQLHVLIDGATYNIKTRVAVPPPKEPME